MSGEEAVRKGVLESLRGPLHDMVVSKRLLGNVRWLQTTCGVNAQGVPSNSAFHALFSLASTLGDEAFYTVALPLGAWMLDLELTRRLAFFWVSVYYVGQATKDLLRLPRPPAPVVRLEHHYSAEYGLPSTHAMGSLIPMFLVSVHHWSTGKPISGALLASCVGWSGVIAVSRLYMGVHSIPDVVAGYIIGGLLLVFWLCFGSAVDDIVTGESWAWLMILTGAGSLVVAYPIPQRWTNSYGDTAIVVATAAGFLLACCFAQEGRRHADVTIEVLKRVHLLSSGRLDAYGWSSLLGDVFRCGVEFLVLLPMRFALKGACRAVMSTLVARSPGWPRSETSRRHAVDIPSKLIVYGCLGFSSCFLVPRVWLRLELDRDS